MQDKNTKIRLQSSADIEPVLDIVRLTGFFRKDEVEIAKEVLQDAADGKEGYQSYVATIDDRPIGWICFGLTPCTLGTFDIYWIAVDKHRQGAGIGSRLLKFAEEKISLLKGKLIVIETSGSQIYQATQRFYHSNGYELEAKIADFYAAGDDKLMFTKSLTTDKN